MTTLLWQEALPSDASAVGLDTPTIKSHWTAIADWLAVTRYWPVSGGGSQASIGELKQGMSLAFFGAKSASSNTIGWYHTARAFADSATSRLYVYESTGTYLGATPFAVFNTTSGAPAVSGPVARSGTTLVSSAGTPTTITVPFSQVFDNPPFVMCTLSALSYVGGSASTVTTGGFTSQFSYYGPGAMSNFTLTYTAFGVDSTGSL